MRVDLNYRADEEFTAVSETGIELDIDMLATDKKKHMSPTQLLLSGVVACAAVDIVSMVKKRRKTFVDLKGTVIGNRADEHPRRFTDIHLHYQIFSPDLTQEEADRIVDLAATKYCSVAASVNAEQTHSVEVIRP